MPCGRCPTLVAVPSPVVPATRSRLGPSAAAPGKCPRSGTSTTNTMSTATNRRKFAIGSAIGTWSG